MFFVCFVAVFAASCRAHATEFLGVRRSDNTYSRGGATFQCLDGSGATALENVNDDFCDCLDGSDEPGTSACAGFPAARFWCRNIGSRGIYLPTSRVDDGVCDCCDGSDESGGECGNNCAAEGAHDRARLAEELVNVQEGRAARAELASKAEAEFNLALDGANKVREELGKSDAVLEAARAVVAELQPAYDAEVKAKDEAKKKKDEISSEDAKQQEDKDKLKTAQESLSADIDSAAESLKGAADDNSAASTLLVAVEDIRRQLDHISSDIAAAVGGGSGSASETTETVGKEGKEEEEVETELARRYADATKAVELAEKDQRATKDRLEAFQKKTDVDYQGDFAFYSLLQAPCVEATAGAYNYEVCPLRSGTQKEGISRTRLGDFTGWVKDEKSGAVTMKFENGERCWNGPARSFHVTVLCGKTELKGVKEPDKCRYEADLYTPAACTDDSLERIQAQIQAFNGGD